MRRTRWRAEAEKFGALRLTISVVHQKSLSTLRIAMSTPYKETGGLYRFIPFSDKGN
jgi:hypothetical protein